MKYIGFWEFCPENMDKAIEKNNQVVAERNTGSKKFGTVIFGPFGLGGEMKGFTVFEVDNYEQLINLSLHYVPYMTWKFVPLLETTKIIELWHKMKK